MFENTDHLKSNPSDSPELRKSKKSLQDSIEKMREVLEMPGMYHALTIINIVFWLPLFVFYFIHTRVK